MALWHQAHATAKKHLWSYDSIGVAKHCIEW